VAGQYEYGPFGEVIRQTGPMAKANPFRFSTKYQDDETGLNYYGYRYYDASAGRWLGRDPIEEDGGANLYCFVDNAPLNEEDILGLDGLPTWALSKEKAYEIAKKNISGEFADRLLRHYLWGGGRTITLGREGLLKGLKPVASLLQSDEFKKDVASSFNGKKTYTFITFDYNNGSGGLGRYYVIANVNVCSKAGSWTAAGTASIKDRWDFDWRVKTLLGDWWYKVIHMQINLKGRETRTALGSLIPGDPFDIKSVEVPVKQTSSDAYLIFGP
jgi:RHS repeat-associated protein